MTSRRLFVVAGACAALLPGRALAQSGALVRRIAVLSPSQSSADEIRETVFPELAKAGFAEGSTLAVTVHVGTPADLRKLSQELLTSKPEVVIASTNAAVTAILDHSPTTPIVMAFAGEDPVAAGLAKSLSRPGGSVTGLTNQATELDGKHVSMLKEVIPAVRLIGVIAVPPPRHANSISEMRRIGRALSIEVRPFYARGPAEYAAAFAEMRAAGVQAVACAAAPEYVNDAAIIGRLAVDAGLPSIGESGSMARNGLLIGYGPDRIAFRRRAAEFVVRILRGAAPGDLPIEQPTVYETVINLKTAKALGLTIPPVILARANEVIE
jgi:putative tryptophan/tyrosine transport system substrate-binding protein